jgi:hypothetical protein
MGLGTEQTTERGIATLVGRMADGFSKLASQHIELARVELAQDMRGMGMDVASIAVFVPFVLVGYLFVCGALAALLAQGLGWAGSLAVVGGANLVGGGLGSFLALKRLRTRAVMSHTTEELNRSVTALAALQGAPSTSTLPVVPQPRVAPVRNVIKEQPHGR